MRTFGLSALAGVILLAGCSDSSDNFGPEVCLGTEVNPERLFLQQLSTDSVMVKWRGNLDGGEQPTMLCYGTDMDNLDMEAGPADITETDHAELTLSGLEPDTTYYYSVGAAGSALQTRSFHTSPADGELPQDGNVRIWIVGDSGTASDGKPEAAEVRDGYLSYVESSGGEPADLFLMLGDNAYNQGTDQEYQVAVFDLYTDIISATPLWPTIGNHEMGTLGISRSADPESYRVLGSGDSGGPDPAPNSAMPYLNIFTLPTDGESGGLASGTEQYYSFDYANIHVVSLDSQLTARDETARDSMEQWLVDDLSANAQDWTIVIFHHPPYTKGSHDSDERLGGIDDPIFDMREQFTPIFDDYGVDVVYSGHSHIYERSLYINGHTGLSETFDPETMAELNDMGDPATGQGDEAYTQIARSGQDDKVVYTVAGNSGKVTTTSEGFPHPAHFFSVLELGSVVIDVDDMTLRADFIDTNGDVLDFFVITR
jgi:hypothetical protein